MFSTTDLIGPLADRGIRLSSSQVYRLVTDRPERLSLKILMALLDILDCSMDDLIEPVAGCRASEEEGQPRAAGPRPASGQLAAQAGADHRDRAVTGVWRAGARRSGRWPARPHGESWSLRSAGTQSSRRSGRRRRGRTGSAASQPPWQAQPGLLTGEGARAPFPGVLRFISALARAGADRRGRAALPSLRQAPPARRAGRGAARLRRMHSKARSLRCGRCGKVRQPARLNEGGQPVCVNCWHRDPRSWKPCAKCGNPRRVAAVTEAGPVCQSCRPGPDLSCSICGSADGGRIGISRATGTPVCERCRKRWVTCSRCGTGAPLKGGTLKEPLCARCLNPDPAFWKRCASCQETWQLSAAECTRCCLDRRLKQVACPARRHRRRRNWTGSARPSSASTARTSCWTG